ARLPRSQLRQGGRAPGDPREPVRTSSAGGGRRVLETFCLADHPDRSEWPVAPVVIDLTGEPDGAVAACQLADEGGVVVLAGSTREPVSDPPVREWARKGLSFLGAHVQSL